MPVARRARCRARSGLTLIEIMVVMAVLGLLAAVGIPAMSGILDLQQQAAAKELAQTYTWLGDEAQLRNVTFRIAFNLDRGTWKIEVGDPDTLVFSDPDARQEYEAAQEDKMSRYTEREKIAGEDGEEGSEFTNRFEGLTDDAFTTQQTLPGGTRFAWIYTPQYGDEGLSPSDTPPDDPEDEVIAYSYVFPDGTAEQTVIRIVDEDDPEDGYTIKVDPMTGTASLTTDVVDPAERDDNIPEEGPLLP